MLETRILNKSENQIHYSLFWNIDQVIPALTVAGILYAINYNISIKRASFVCNIIVNEDGASNKNLVLNINHDLGLLNPVLIASFTKTIDGLTNWQPVKSPGIVYESISNLIFTLELGLNLPAVNTLTILQNSWISIIFDI